jgi:WD40 repeat protein
MLCTGRAAIRLEWGILEIMATDLTSGIARILSPDGNTAGTGFVVADGLLVTCAHVIPVEAQPKDGKPGADVELVFRTGGQKALARVVPEWFRPDDAEDVAFLRLKEPLQESVRPLFLGSSLGAGGHPFRTFGFPSASPDEGIWGDGLILAETLMQGMKVLQLKSSEITRGFSGAPVFDTASGRVVGMVNAIAPQDVYGRLAETAFITPAETLRLICPQLVLSDVQPYLGLSAFTESDAEFFFGREREVVKLLDALRREPRFLAVLGPSGSGKSSVVQSGLIPELRRCGLPGSDRWGIITARPGEKPLRSLEAGGLALAERGLVLATRGWLEKNPERTRLMLIIDQFEELFAAASPPDAAEFLSQLQSLLKADLPLTLMLIMRDDFFSRLGREASPALFEWVQRGFVHISAALEVGEIAEIIEGPARKVGLQFEEGLADAIVRDVLEGGERAGRSTVLPLLEFALTQLWMRRREGYLTHEAYSAIGGVTGSLTQWADQAYQSLAQEGLGDPARRVLAELVNLGDERQGVPDSRRRRSMEDFGSDPAGREKAGKVIKKLADARLVATSFDQQNKQESVEIIHDTLIREWARLQLWLKKDRAFLSWQRELEKDAREWWETSPEAIGRDEGRLLRGRRLEEAERWQKERGRDLGEGEREFVQASLELREREREKEEKARAEKEWTRRRYTVILSFIAIIALVFAGVAYQQKEQADEKKEEALALYLASQSEQIDHNNDKILLAAESLRHKETAEGDMALRNSIKWKYPLRLYLFNQYAPPNNAIAFISNGSKVLRVLTGGDERIYIFDGSGDEIANISFGSAKRISVVAFSPDGSRALALRLGQPRHYDSAACILDTSTGRLLHNLSYMSKDFPPAFSPDGSKVVTVKNNEIGSHDCTVFIWDALTGQLLHSLSHTLRVIKVAFSPDGSKVVTVTNNDTGGNHDTVFIWDALTGQLLDSLSHSWWVTDVTFSPDGSKVLTGSGDGIARIFDASTGVSLHNLSHQVSGGNYSLEDFKFLEVRSVAFSPDGSKVLTGSKDGTARIWDTLTGLQLLNLNHGRMVLGAIFSPDGSKILTKTDTVVCIWDAFTGEELHRLPKPESVVYFGFSPDGSKVLIGSLASAWVWPVSYGDLIKQACNCSNDNLTLEEWKGYKISYPKTCPKEGGLNQSTLTRLRNDPLGFLTGSPECQPCIAEAFANKR